MLRKLPDKISRFLIYLTAFGVSALMAIMLIHIIKESIPAFSELGIKMFLPSTEWRPVSANPQFGLLPAITGTLYVSFIAVVLALIFGVACACFLNFYLPGNELGRRRHPRHLHRHSHHRPRHGRSCALPFRPPLVA